MNKREIKETIKNERSNYPCLKGGTRKTVDSGKEYNKEDKESSSNERSMNTPYDCLQSVLDE